MKTKIKFQLTSLFPIIVASTMLASTASSEAAVIVSGGGTSGQSVTITITSDIVIASNPGSSFGGYYFGFKINNVFDGAASTAAQYQGNWYDIPNTTVDDAIYKSSGSSSEEILSTSNASVNSGEDPLWVYFGAPGWTEYLVSDGASVTFKAGTITLAPGGGNLVLLNPGASFDVTASNFFSVTEQYQTINSQNVAIVPETSTALLGLIGLGAMMRRRR
ncbi:MAG: hypothetical protein ACOVRB_09230 [Akkermansiaceae bacterium]